MKGSMLMFVALSCFSCCMAQVPGFGSCPTVTVKDDFDLSKYLGEWYEAERYFTTFEVALKCNTAHYSMNDDGSITVLNSGISTWTGATSNVTGIATLNPQQPGKLGVVFPGYTTTPGPYWILDTDYENYSVVWSCKTFSFLNAKMGWILTRSNKPSSDVMNQAHQVLSKNGISQTLFMKSDQTGCPQGY